MHMSHSCNGGNNGFNGNQDTSLARHISRFIGETVTIFTTSGGASGCGFTGVVLTVNQCFVRLVTEQGIAPTNPLAENICPDMDNGPGGGIRGLGEGLRGCGRGNGNGNGNMRTVGSVCDIPIDRIAAFCHNAV
jgi:hypothetical protein